MSDKSGDILLIAGFLIGVYGWLKLRMQPKGRVEFGPVTMVGDDGTVYSQPTQPAPSAPFTADFASSLFSSFMPSMTPPAQVSTPAAVPKVDPVEQDWLARTIWGEARGDKKPGMRAVAAVIMNRIASRRYPGTVQAVVTQRWQFSMWNPGEHNGAAARGVTTADADFRDALSIAEDALTGRLSDPTGGATLYYAPKSMVPPGSKPSWDFTKLRFTVQIGGHLFYAET